MSLMERDPYGMKLQRARELDAQIAAARLDLARLEARVADEQRRLDRLIRPRQLPVIGPVLLGVLSTPVVAIALAALAAMFSALAGH
jgi:hypothetical protein